MLRKNFDWNSCNDSLVLEREGQERRRDSRVPLWALSDPQHSGSVHMPSLFQGTQCPERASTLYLPDKNLAWVVAFSSSHAEDPQVKKMGWHLVRPKYSVLRYCKEGRVSA